MKKFLSVSCLVICSLLAACTGGGSVENEKKYTPLEVYFNPLANEITEISSPGSLLAYEANYFLNYPNDLARLSLCGPVRRVIYGKHPERSSVEFFFNKNGFMTEIHSGMYLFTSKPGITRFKYDDHGRFMGWVNVDKANWEGDYRIKYKYDENGCPESNRDKSGLTMNFSYFDDGTLKGMTLDGVDDFQHRWLRKGNMKYNEKGQLVRMEAICTYNQLIAEGLKNYYIKYPSVSTFEYNEDGLCTRKYEEVFFIDRKKNDTLKIMPCDNIFTYNEKGDLASWTYTGGSYYTDKENRNLYGFEEVSFTIKYEYLYDDYGNWRRKYIIMPENITENINLHKFYYYNNQEYDGFREYEPEEGARPVVVLNRILEYYLETDVDKGKGGKEAAKQKKPEGPAYTAAQGMGLYGKVKSIYSDGSSIFFDEYGNIARLVNGNSEEVYKYKTPFTYTIPDPWGNEIGPYRIECEENTRKEKEERSGNIEALYEFDNKGRLIRHRYFEGMMPAEATYTYDGKNKLPAYKVCKHEYEEGTDTETCQYLYLGIDKKGNWTMRKVRRTWNSETYNYETKKYDISTRTEPDFTESRTIAYY